MMRRTTRFLSGERCVVECPPMNRRGIMLVAAIVVVFLLTTILGAVMAGLQHRSSRTRQWQSNAQAELAALAVATSPTEVTSLELPDGREAEVGTDRVVLRDPNGVSLAAAPIPVAEPTKNEANK